MCGCFFPPARVAPARRGRGLGGRARGVRRAEWPGDVRGEERTRARRRAAGSRGDRGVPCARGARLHVPPPGQQGAGGVEGWRRKRQGVVRTEYTPLCAAARAALAHPAADRPGRSATQWDQRSMHCARSSAALWGASTTEGGSRVDDMSALGTRGWFCGVRGCSVTTSGGRTGRAAGRRIAGGLPASGFGCPAVPQQPASQRARAPQREGEQIGVRDWENVVRVQPASPIPA